MEQNKWNGMSVAGFVVSMASLLLNFWGLVGLVGTILSGVGLSQVNARGERGKGLAVAGLIVGIVGIVYGVYAVLALSAAVNSLF